MKTAGNGTSRRYGGKSQRERQAERYEKLIDAGIEVIGRAGYEAASLRVICNEAGLTERYFYESFNNREALLAAVYLRVNELLKTRVQDALAAAPPEPLALCRTGAETFFGMLKEDPRLARIMLFETVNISHRMSQLNREVEQQFVLQFLQAVHAHAVQRRLPPEREALVAAGLFGAVVNIAMRWVLDDFRQPLEDLVESTVVIFDAVRQSVWGNAS